MNSTVFDERGVKIAVIGYVTPETKVYFLILKMELYSYIYTLSAIIL